MDDKPCRSVDELHGVMMLLRKRTRELVRRSGISIGIIVEKLLRTGVGPPVSGRLDVPVAQWQQPSQNPHVGLR